MKLTLLILGFLSLTACSSLVTRGNLRDCADQCAAKGSCMMKVSKHEGHLNCECSPVKEEKNDGAAMEKEIKEISEELEKSLNAAPVEIPATEQEIVPAEAEIVIPEQIQPIKSEAPVVEETPITVEEIKIDSAPVAPEQK